MTTAQKVIKTKVGLLELGKQLGNVSKAWEAWYFLEDERPKSLVGGSRASTFRLSRFTAPASEQKINESDPN